MDELYFYSFLNPVLISYDQPTVGAALWANFANAKFGLKYFTDRLFRPGSRTGQVFFLLLFLFSGKCSLTIAAEKWSSIRLDPALLRGPLKIAADATVSKNQGKEIFASGNVSLRYEMDGETLECRSQFLKYTDASGEGELWGSPHAIWTQSKVPPSAPQKTILTAEKIIFRLKESELAAKGSVEIFQGSSTLTAGQAHFFDSEKKLVASGGRPTFSARQTPENIQISAEEILSFVEQKKVQFRNRVRGKIEFIK